MPTLCEQTTRDMGETGTAARPPASAVVLSMSWLARGRGLASSHTRVVSDPGALSLRALPRVWHEWLSPQTSFPVTTGTVNASMIIARGHLPTCIDFVLPLTN